MAPQDESVAEIRRWQDFRDEATMAALAECYERVVLWLAPPQIVFVVPEGTMRGFSRFLGCKVVHGCVGQPSVAIPVWRD